MRVVGSVVVRGEKIMFGAHAVDRFRERAYPSGFSEGRRKLIELASEGTLTYERPTFFMVPTLRDAILNVAFLMFEVRDNLVILPLMPWPGGLVAPTCVVKEGKSLAAA